MKAYERIFEVNMKTWLSTLWIFVSVNYIFCDVLSIMDPEFIQGIVSGTAPVQMTQGALLAAGISLEIPFIMIILSRILKYGVNRWANIAAGLLMVLYQVASFFVGTSTLHYIFFSVVEIGCDLLIVWFAWKWSKPEIAE